MQEKYEKITEKDIEETFEEIESLKKEGKLFTKRHLRKQRTRLKEKRHSSKSIMFTHSTHM